MIAIEIVGYSTAGPDTLSNAYGRSDWRALVSFGGDYVLIFRDGGAETLVSSLYGVQPYYLGPDGRHGPHVAPLSRGAIDFEALATLIALSHTVGRQSLAADVQRMPAASICRWQGGRWHVEELPQPDFHKTGRTRPGDAVDAFRAALAECAGNAPVVSMTGGFDSRTILAAALASGLRPPLLTMGEADSADVVAARAMAAMTGLEIAERPLAADDYFHAAPEIARLTDGQKGADHWHSYFYASGNAFPRHARLLVGANGEFARTYYLDRGPLPLAEPIADLAAQTAKRLFWRAKLGRQKFSPSQIALMPEPLRSALSAEATQARADMLAALTPGRFFEGLDWFYLQQRVRHFIGYGMRLIGNGMEWRSPFLDRDWVTAIAGLPRRWKTASNWHRFAIATMAPELLRYPEAGFAGPMRARATPWRGATWPRSPKGPPYADYRRWFNGETAARDIENLREPLSATFGEALPAQIAAQCRAGAARPEIVGLLLALGWWQKPTCRTA